MVQPAKRNYDDERAKLAELVVVYLRNDGPLSQDRILDKIVLYDEKKLKIKKLPTLGRLLANVVTGLLATGVIKRVGGDMLNLREKAKG